MSDTEPLYTPGTQVHGHHSPDRCRMVPCGHRRTAVIECLLGCLGSPIPRPSVLVGRRAINTTAVGGWLSIRHGPLRREAGGGGFGMTPWCDDLVCSWWRLLADRHSLPLPWTLFLHWRWCPSASQHPVTFLFLPALTVPLPCPFLSLGLSLHRPRCPSASHHSFQGGGGVPFRLRGAHRPPKPSQVLGVLGEPFRAITRCSLPVPGRRGGGGLWGLATQDHVISEGG